MAHLAVDIKVQRATKKLAKEMAEMVSTVYERPLRDTRVAHLMREFEEGRGRTCYWATAFIEESNETYRVNGQHSSYVLATIDKIPSKVSVVITSYYCETMQDLADLYRTFDAPESTRSVTDTLAMDRAINLALQVLSTTNLSRCAAGIMQAMNKGKPAKRVRR